MKVKLISIIMGLTMVCSFSSMAHATETNEQDAVAIFDEKEVQRLIDEAEQQPVLPDKTGHGETSAKVTGTIPLVLV